MPRFSIVVLVAGEAPVNAALAESLTKQLDSDFELVCVVDEGAREACEAYAALTPKVVEAAGTPGEKRNAAVGSCEGEFVCFLDSYARVAPAFARTLGAQIDKARLNKKAEGPEVVAYHMQKRDTGRSEYLTVRESLRRSVRLEPYAATFHAERLFQKLDGCAGDKLFAREYLERKGAVFCGRTLHADDPGVLRLIAGARAIISTSLPLGVELYDPRVELSAAGADARRAMLEDAAALAAEFDEGEAHALAASYLEWLVGFCADSLAHLEGEEREAFMDVMRELALPAFESRVDASMNPERWSGMEAFRLGCLDRSDLFEEALRLSEAGHEERYERVRLEYRESLIAPRKGIAVPEAKPKRKGLFRR